MKNEKELCLDQALRILDKRMQTKVQLEQKLKNKGFATEIVSSVLLECESRQYLNDYEYVRAFIADRSKFKPMGSWRLKQELLDKGVADDVIKEILEIYLPAEVELTLLEELFQKKWGADESYRRKPKKLINFLMRRGFSKNQIFRVVENLSIDIWKYNRT